MGSYHSVHEKTFGSDLSRICYRIFGHDLSRIPDSVVRGDRLSKPHRVVGRDVHHLSRPHRVVGRDVHGHSEIYPSTLNVVSNCPSRGEYMQRSFAKCAGVCEDYMLEGNCAYHCMRDSSKTKLVEFCAKPKPLFDYCPEYDPVDQTIQKDTATLCNSTFSQNYYNSSDIYFCDPNNCLQLHESSARSGATTLTTLMNETTEVNDGDSQELFVRMFVTLAALTLVFIIGCILLNFVRRGYFPGRTGKTTKKRNQNGKQYEYTEKRITD